MANRHLQWTALVATAGLGLADTACAGTQVLNAAGWVQGQSALTDDFMVTGPGTLTVTIQDYVLPTSLQSLTFNLFGTGSATPNLMGSMSGAGTEQFKINTGQRLSAQLYAVAGGAADVGLYGETLTFTPAGSPVPLPRSGGLLVAGLGVIGWLASGRRRPGGVDRKAS
jgi:hypothetical protein